MSDWIPPTQNVPSREEDWFRGVYCMHRAFCGCNDPVRHLASLAANFGFQPAPASRSDPSAAATPPLVRNLRALPAAPTTPRPPSCGGTGGRGAGGDRADDGGRADGDDFQSGDVGELLDMLDDAE
nr:ORF2 [Torque teno virus]